MRRESDVINIKWFSAILNLESGQELEAKYAAHANRDISVPRSRRDLGTLFPLSLYLS